MNQFQKYLDYDVQIAKIPLSFWHFLIIIAAIFYEYTNMISGWQAAAAIALIVVYNVIHWFSKDIIFKIQSGYFIVQATILYGCALLLPNGSPFILLGLLPVLIVYTFHYFNALYKVTLFILFYYSLYGLTIGFNLGLKSLIVYMILFIAILGISLFVVILFNKEVLAKKRLEHSLAALAEANQQIEKLTIANERQRIARDLHDSLTQHLAGLILQLDAADAHLDETNMEKAHQIIKKAMQQAQLSLEKSRNVVSDLRSFDRNRTWESRFHEEIQHFQHMTKVKVHVHAVQYPRPSATTTEHSTAIIREILHNIQKHAKALEVHITVTTQQNGFAIDIMDNGVGFHVENALLLEGHFGLRGMKERVQLIHGSIQYSSTDDGTRVTFFIPNEGD